MTPPPPSQILLRMGYFHPCVFGRILRARRALMQLARATDAGPIDPRVLCDAWRSICPSHSPLVLAEIARAAADRLELPDRVYGTARDPELARACRDVARHLEGGS